jgi:hypothetical protein
MPTVYSNEIKSNPILTAEQNKYAASVFTSAIEPSIKNTKGLKGRLTARDGIDWEFEGGFNGTPDNLTSTTLQMYMAVMGCSKDKKIKVNDESGLIINFALNSLHFISEMSENETYRNGKKVFLPNKIAGSQIFDLKQATKSVKYDSLTFYCKTDDAEYFLVTNKEKPFFIPVTVRQGLELSISNMNAEIAEINKQSGSFNILSKEAWLKKEGIQPMEGLTAKQVQEVNDAGYQGYVEGSKGAIQQNNFFLDSYKKNIALVNEFLKINPAKILDRPLNGYPFSFFTDVNDIREVLHIDDGIKSDAFVIINPAYLNAKLPKAAPQFVCIEIRAQTNDGVTQKAYNDFKAKLDLDKLQSLLAK